MLGRAEARFARQMPWLLIKHRQHGDSNPHLPYEPELSASLPGSSLPLGTASSVPADVWGWKGSGAASSAPAAGPALSLVASSTLSASSLGVGCASRQMGCCKSPAMPPHLILQAQSKHSYTPHHLCGQTAIKKLCIDGPQGILIGLLDAVRQACKDSLWDKGVCSACCQRLQDTLSLLVCHSLIKEALDTLDTAKILSLCLKPHTSR